MLTKTPLDIGLGIRQHRRRLGLDQAELARRVGVSRQWIVEVERGKPRAEIGLILRTLGALELEVDIGPRKKKAAPPTAVDLEQVIARTRKRK